MSIPAPTWTQVPNALLDEWLPRIETLAELKVALAIVRVTAGWHQEREVLSLSTLQRATGLGRAAVCAGLKAAMARGYVDRVAEGGSFAYMLVVEGVVRSANQASSLSEPPASSLSEPVASSLSEPPIKKEGKKESLPTAETARAADAQMSLDGTVVPLRPPKRKSSVGTPAERRRAGLILSEFNQRAGTAYTASAYVDMIVRRIEEHPELTLEAHVGVIQRNLIAPWWSGRPAPNVIYGSGEQFERSMHATGVAPEPEADWANFKPRHYS